jgi:hypothetical protein
MCPPSMMAQRKPPALFLFFFFSLSSFGRLGFVNHPSIRAHPAHRNVRSRLLNLLMNAAL